MEKPFQKDLSHLSWDEVYARQVQRAPLVGAWLDALELKPGDRVLDIGPGPGFVSLVLAERVGPGGLIYAIDPSAEALGYLARLQKARGLSNIKTRVADAAQVDLPGVRLNAALISMVLHHADDPPGILRNIARLLGPGALALVAEFHPEGPSRQGPPRDRRLASRQIQEWCEAAGFETLRVQRQSPEHYMVLLRRRPD
jgi:ubiquinone/menaquinone biosynthesis C-methylase UbiE